MRSFLNKIKSININIYLYTLIYTIFTILFFNIGFFGYIININNNYGVIFDFCIILTCVFNIIFSIIFSKKTVKFLSILFLLINAGILYFMNTYNVSIDRTMLINALETNVAETMELLNLKFVLYLFVFAIIPGFFIFNININNNYKLLKTFLCKIGIIALSLIIGCITLFLDYKELSSTARVNRNIKYKVIPLNYFDSLYSLARRKIENKKIPFQDLTDDVKISNNFVNDKKNVLVFIVGEAARSIEFSLNNYEKDTNAPLKDKDVIFYDNFYSCGTATAISVPCMFSSFERKNFNLNQKDSFSNLFDFLTKANIYSYWRDNNSDCKGVCNRIENDNVVKEKLENICNSKECYDEILITDLEERIKNLKNQNNVLVLHQKGSHGPAYYLRYPKEFEKFSPVCETESFDKCSVEEIKNAYDNTIYYTSYIINKTIEILQKYENDFNVSLIYVSDHGQSLGENGLYLHGAPYNFSPDEQRHIPYMMWLSKNFADNFKINRECLNAQRNEHFSQDNIFHSILGLFGVETKYYNADLDLFKNCRIAK